MHAPHPTIERVDLDAGFRVGAFLVEPRLQRVTRPEGEAVPLEPRVMEVLVRLAQEPGHPVSKDVLLDELWPDVVVTDDALLRCIGELRRAFGDDARAPRYIETIRKRGYRIVAPVSLSTPAAPPPPEPEPPAAPGASRRAGWGLLGAALGAAAIGAGAFAVWPTRAPEPAPPLPHRAAPLTSLHGAERDPQLSPDGTQLAFVWDGGDDGGADLYVLQVGVGTPLRLTDTPDDEASPAWSPDGQRVAFVRGRAVFVVPALGGVERRLVDLGRRAVREVAWSPDGETLAVSAETEPGGAFGLSLVPLETLRPVPLTAPPSESIGDLHPAFSPDGRHVAFARSVADRSDDVFVIELGATEPRRLTSDHAEITGLDWTRDGRRVVVASDRGGGGALWAVPLDGSPPAWVPTAGEGRGVQQPTLARRSGRLAFVQRDEETNLWAVPLDSSGSPPRAPLVASTRWDSHPSLSPDGQRLAFVSDRSGVAEVWVSWADGVDPYPVTSLGGAFVSTPRWSPDGRRLAFVATSAGSADVYVVDAAGGRPLRITTVDANDRAPSWSRDGRTLLFASARSGRWEVWARPSDGTGGPVQVTREGASAAQESPDGRTLYFTKAREDGLWRRPRSGGRAELVVPSLRASDWGNWAVTRSGVVYVRREGATSELRRWDPSTGDDDGIAPLDRFPAHPGLAVSADGARVVVARMDRGASDVLLVENVD